jgi:predicted DNA-binding transcriptional regulator YafY
MTTRGQTASAQKAPREADFAKDADKLIRRLSLVAYLLTRSNRPVRAEQIRARVEGYPGMTDDAFKRRFYEDRTELALLGIEIQGEQDEDSGGELYSLPAAGYYLPAIDLDREELLALGSCLLVLEERFAYSKPLRLALLSLAQGRPELLEQEAAPPLAVLTTREALRASARLPRLQDAVADRKTIVFDYYAIGHDQTSERTVDPYGLLLVGDEWYLVGFCHLRRALRTFRLSRIRSRVRHATRRPHDFTVPADFSLAAFRDRPPWQLRDGGPIARIQVRADMAWWVEAHYAHCGAIEPDADGGVVYSTRFAAARPLASWALGMGGSAQVLEPPELLTLVTGQLDLLLRRLDAPPADADRARGSLGGGSAPVAGGRAAGTPATDDWHVEVDRFTRLTALASYLLARCGDGGMVEIDIDHASADLGTSPAELRGDVRLLNLVNFGGDGGLLYAEVKRRRLEVVCDLAGPALAAPARLSPLQADTLLLAVELVGGRLPSAATGALGSAARKVAAARHGAAPTVEAAAAVDASEDILTAVNTAVRDHRLLDIEYWSEGRDEHSSRTVEPYMLVRQRGQWYYVCHCLRSQGVRTFRVDTTKSARLREERFEPRPEVQVDLYRREGIPTSEQYTAQSARIWYGAPVARWVTEREEVTGSGDGVVAVQPYLDEPWLVHHVLRYGGEAVPLSPPQAVAAVKRCTTALRAAYAGPAAGRGDDSRGEIR